MNNLSRNPTLWVKFDPENESVASVGEDLGEGCEKYENTVLGTNGWLYGIPDCSNRIVRFNPADQTTSTVGGRQSIKSFYVEVVCWGEKFHFLFGMTLEVKKYDNNI